MADGHTFLDGAPEVAAPPDTVNREEACQRLLQAAHDLVERINQREEEVRRLLRVTENINRGLSFEEVLELLFEELRPLIPFNRIGCALIDEVRGLVVAHWARSDRPVHLGTGFRAPLAGSTLADIVKTGRPRILNDLPAYLRDKPRSASTELIVREGMRSSLTCPLVVQGRPIGFLFFSSEQTAAYSNVHVEFFQQIAGQLAVIVEKGRLYSELARQAALIAEQNWQMLRELEMARQLQQTMIPKASLRLPGLAHAFVYRSALRVGGDLLDILPLPDGRVLAFVGDAMGHGVQAAMVMAAAETALHTASRVSSDPDEVLRRVNQELHEMLLGERFMTAVCARVDPAGGRVDLALAGHPSPILVSAASGGVSRPGDADTPLGVRASATFDATSCPFEPGDSLIFFTDGVVDAKDIHGVRYGEERLFDLVGRHVHAGPKEMISAVEEDIQRHCQTAGQPDDQAILVLQLVGGKG